MAIAADVNGAKQVALLYDETVKTFGRLDVLVNNAGIEKKMPFVDIPEDEWNKVIAVNLTGPFLCSQCAAKQMIAQGDGCRIIVVELAPHNILINNVAPGAVDTPMNAKRKADAPEMKVLLAEIPPSSTVA